jgi:ankyrin repeat protein
MRSPLTLLLAVVACAVPAGAAPERARDLIAAVRRGDAGRVEALVRSGADVNAATASGLTPLLEAAARGRTDIARTLLAAGADVDARHRELGTPLDAAERAGHEPVAELLRAHGARGSGKSVGDTVCVKRWAGDGFCGRVEGRSGNRYRLEVLRVEGCALGCAPDDQCSAGRAVGGASRDAVHAGDELLLPSWCLTHTGLEPRP